MRFLLAIVLLATFALVGCEEKVAVDDRLIGEWVLPAQPLTGGPAMRFEIRGSGRYLLKSFSVEGQTVRKGAFTAAQGEWSRIDDEGPPDRGTYEFTGPDSIRFVGQSGIRIWERARPGENPETSRASLVDTAPASIAPESVSWPIAGFPQLAERALRVAHSWHPDAVLMRISAERLGPRASGYVDSPVGKIKISFRFDSRSAHESMLMVLGQPGKEITISPIRGVGDDLASIPEDFLDMDEAVRRASAMGMDTTEIKSVVLEDFTDRTIGGLSGLRLAWMIYPPNYSQAKITAVPLRVAVEAMRFVDTCAVINSDDARLALGRDVTNERENPRDGVWTCRYSVVSGRHRELLIRIDEDPYRDARTFIERQRKNRREDVAGVGDEAVLFNSPVGSTFLDIRVGDTLIQINVDGEVPGTRHETALSLGATAVARFKDGIGAGFAKGPLGRVVGDWSATYEESSLTLQIDKNLALIVTAETPTESVSGRGYVTRSEKGGAEFHLPGRVGRAVRLDFERSAVADRFDGDGSFDMLLFGVRRLRWERFPEPEHDGGGADMLALEPFDSGDSAIPAAPQAAPPPVPEPEAGRKTREPLGAATAPADAP